MGVWQWSSRFVHWSPILNYLVFLIFKHYLDKNSEVIMLRSPLTTFKVSNVFGASHVIGANNTWHFLGTFLTSSPTLVIRLGWSVAIISKSRGQARKCVHKSCFEFSHFLSLAVYPTQHSGYHMSLAKMDSAPSSSVVGIHALHTGNLHMHANSEASLLKMSDLPIPSRLNSTLQIRFHNKIILLKSRRGQHTARGPHPARKSHF